MTDELTPVRCGCGGEAHIYKAWGVRLFYVACKHCQVRTTDYESATEAIEAWNKAMGAKDINVPNKERTAKVIEHDGVVTMDGRKYHHMEYLCGHCKKKVLGGDSYCSHCGAKLDWSGNESC